MIAALLLALALSAPVRVVDAGLAVDFTREPDTPRDGDALSLTFRLSDTATGTSLTSARPAAWLAPRQGSASPTPQQCARKVAAFMGGSLLQRPSLDLNGYLVLTLDELPQVSVVDPRFGFGGSRLLASIPLPSPGADWVLTRDARTLFVSVPEAGVLVAADTASWRVKATLEVGGHPARLVLEPAGRRLWALTDSGATLLDVESLRTVAQVALPEDAPRSLAFDDLGHFAFLGLARGLRVLDLEHLDAPRDVALGFAPRELAYSSAARLAYAADPESGRVAGIEAARARVLAAAQVEPGFTQLRFAPGGRWAFLPNPARHVVEVFDTAHNRVARTVDVTLEPERISFSDRLAYIQRRGSESVLMLALSALDESGEGVGLADFPAGEHPLGPASALPDALVEAPDAPAALVANTRDRAVYYYKEGMAAPMGAFPTGGGQPRAVLVVDRSLREEPDGRYATTVQVEQPGAYDVVLYLDSPRVVACFSLDVAARPETLAAQPPRTRIEMLEAPGAPSADAPFRLRVRLRDADTGAVRAGLGDVQALLLEAPGTWQQRAPARPLGGGVYDFAFEPRSAGLYYVYVASAAAGLPLNNPQFLTLQVRSHSVPGGRQP